MTEKQSILFVAVGSRGDNEPIHAIISHILLCAKHIDVHLFSSAQYNAFLPTHPRLHLHDASLFSIASFYGAMQEHYTPPKTAKPVGDASFQAQLQAVGAITAHCVTPLLPELDALIKEDSSIKLLVATTLSLVVCTSLAEKHDIPVLALHFQPNAPTSAFPCYMSSRKNAEQAARILAHGNAQHTEENKVSFECLLWFFRQGLENLNEYRRELLDLSNDMTENDILSLLEGEHEKVVQVHSISTPLLHCDIQQNAAVKIVQPLTPNYKAHDWTPQSKCVKTLGFVEEDNESPLVCISIGSMRVSDERKQEVTESLIRGTQNAFSSSSTPRIVVIGFEANEEKNVFVVPSDEAVQFSWLFPKCSLVICHGGAGVTSTAVHHGTPVVIFPVLCDQYFWAEAVEQAKVGAYGRCGMHAVTTGQVAETVGRALEKQVYDQCAVIRQKGAQESSGNECLLHIMLNMIV